MVRIIKSHADGAESEIVLKWWPIIVVLIGWAVAGLLAYGDVRSNIKSVESELQSHEQQQSDTVKQMRDDLSYIRSRVDRAIEQGQK